MRLWPHVGGTWQNSAASAVLLKLLQIGTSIHGKSLLGVGNQEKCIVNMNSGDSRKGFDRMAPLCDSRFPLTRWPAAA